MLTKYFFARAGAVWSGFDSQEKAIEFGTRIARDERARGDDRFRTEFGWSTPATYVIEEHVYGGFHKGWSRTYQDVRL